MKSKSAKISSHCKTIFFAIIFFMPLLSKAQDNNIKNEILSYNDSVTDIISKGRKLLTQKLLEGDTAKVRQIKDYLLAKPANKDYLVFYSVEYYLILYWTQEYKEMLTAIVNHDSINTAQGKKIRPSSDQCYTKITEKTIASKKQVIQTLAAADLSEVDKDFLRLHLEYTFSRVKGYVITRDSLNKMANNFLEKHPDSRYESYVRKYIRFELDHKWGLGVEYFSGYGFFTGNLAKNYTNSVPVGIAFDIQYKNWILYLRDFIGFGQTKTDIPYSNGIWTRNSQTLVYLPEASIGYVALDNRRFKLAPFIGIASSDIAPTGNDLNIQPSLKNAEMEFSRTYTFGLNGDIKLGRTKMRKPTAHIIKGHWFVRVRYAYNMPQFGLRYPGVTGNFHYITIGIGAFDKRNKRKY